MKVLLATLSIALLVPAGLSGCGDDPVKPGSIVARWDLKPSTCDGLHLAKIRASAFRGSATEPENFAEVPCADSGEVTIDPVAPGSYNVVIDGLNQDPTPRATHSASATVSVSEGGQGATAELRLKKKPARLHIQWSFADGLDCVTNEVQDVYVEILDDGNNTLKEQTVPCLNTFVDAADGKTKSGVLFEEVESEKTLTLLLTGSDASKNTVREGEEAGVVLLAGDAQTVIVKMCGALPCQ